MESYDKIVGESRQHFLASIEHFMEELQGRLAETPRGKLTDTKELRMLSSIVMRSFDIWARALATGEKDQSSLEKLQRVKKIFQETVGGAE
jgi:hypothetical protein